MLSPIFLDLLRVSLSLMMLSYASWRDVKTREISDRIWIIFLTPALGLDFYEICIGGLNVFQFILSIIFSFVTSFSLAYFGLFGGADFKAFVVLSLLQPVQPRFINPLLNVVSGIYSITIFANSAVSGAYMAVVTLIRNIVLAYEKKSLFENDLNVSLPKKLLIMLAGVKMNINKVRGPPFEYPLEIIEGKSRKLVVAYKPLKDEEAVRVINELKASGVTEVWVSHTLPYLVFITIGFILSILLGDIILWTVKLTLNPR